MIEFEDIINQKKREAVRKQVARKATEVAKLGTMHPKKHGVWHIFEDGDLQIEWDDYNNSNLIVTWHGQQVFVVHLGDITTYRPDIPTWESHLEVLYNTKALPLIQVKSQAEKLKELKELEEKWGITELVAVRA